MLSTLAQALETLLGRALVPTASALRFVAALTLVAAVLAAGIAMTRAIAAWRFGWIPATVVRCRICGRVAPDPAVPACPEGHPVRFPASAVRELAAPSRSRRRLRAAWPVILSGAIGAAAAGLYFAAGPVSLTRPVATITASASYLFFAAALAAASFALAARPVGLFSRLLHAGLMVACVVPALLLAWLAHAFEPPIEREIGSLWITPASLYVSSGSRARREAPAVQRLDAVAVDARLPGLGVVWEGLEGFHAAGVEVPWRGKGGWVARMATRWTGPAPSAGSLFTRSVQSLTLDPNRRVRILATREHVRFVPEP
jgi:hypothetical protein